MFGKCIMFYCIQSIIIMCTDGHIDIHSLDIPVNAVATALKDFFSKRLPPLIDKERMNELEDISGNKEIN